MKPEKLHYMFVSDQLKQMGICIGILLLSTNNIFAQKPKPEKLSPGLFASAGSSATLSNTNYSWSIGEAVVFFGTDANGHASSGFQQPMVCRTIPIITASGITGCTQTYMLQTDNLFNKYVWKIGTSTIVNARTFDYPPVENGNYTVYVADSTGCYMTSSIFAVDMGTKNIVPFIVPTGSAAIDTLLETSTATSYQWFVVTPTDGVHRAIVNAYSQTYKPLYNGTYYVQINTKDNCTSYSDYYVVNNNGYDNILKHSFEMDDRSIVLIAKKAISDGEILAYPVPVKDKMTIEYATANAKPIRIQLIDAKGTLVYSSQSPISEGRAKHIMLTHTNPSGTYLLNIIDGDKSTSKEIIIE